MADDLIKYIYSVQRAKDALDFESFNHAKLKSERWTLNQLKNIPTAAYLDTFLIERYYQADRIREHPEKWRAGTTGIIEEYPLVVGVGTRDHKQIRRELDPIVDIQPVCESVENIFRDICERHGKYGFYSYGDYLLGQPSSSLALKEAFSVTRFDQNRQPIRLPANKELTLQWHGTKFTNLPSIFANGLLGSAPPNVSTAGSNYTYAPYGPGLYTADIISYAGVYSGFHKTDTAGRIAILGCLVDPGTKIDTKWPAADMPRPEYPDWGNFDSRKVVGRVEPYPYCFRRMPDDVRDIKLRYGDISSTGFPNAFDVYNEFITPPHRVKEAIEVRYLLIVDRTQHAQHS